MQSCSLSQRLKGTGSADASSREPDLMPAILSQRLRGTGSADATLPNDLSLQSLAGSKVLGSGQIRLPPGDILPRHVDPICGGEKGTPGRDAADPRPADRGVRGAQFVFMPAGQTLWLQPADPNGLRVETVRT